MNLAVPVFLWTGVLLFAAIAHRRHGKAALRDAGRFAVGSGISLAPRLAVALLAAAFLAETVPPDIIGGLIGESSGVSGILIASAIGGLLPGGPMTSFPIAVFLWGAGGGVPQLVALLTGWSVFAFHRVLAYEIPLMGWRFSLLRLLAVAIIPPLSGLIADLLLGVLGDSVTILPSRPS